MPRAKPWTGGGDRMLVDGAGAFALAWFGKRVGTSYDYPGAPPRTRAALYARARRLWGPGGLSRGVYSLRQLAQESGYAVTQLRRAQSALNHKYKRLSPRGRHLISYDQREDIYAWLAQDFWCVRWRLYNCGWCHLRNRAHKGGGLCARCYFVHRRLCAALGISSGRIAQQALLKSLDSGEAAVAQAKERLARGLALPQAFLERLKPC